MKNLMLAAIALIALMTPAFAEGVNGREGNQVGRITSGVNSGSMTANEAYRASRNLHRVNRLENYFRCTGGTYGPRERAVTQGMLNATSRQIYRYKHNPYSR